MSTVLTRWVAPVVLAAGFGAGAATAPAPARADDLTRVIVDVADVIYHAGNPYYRYDRGYRDRLVVVHDYRGRPTYYRNVYRAGPPRTATPTGTGTTRRAATATSTASAPRTTTTRVTTIAMTVVTTVPTIATAIRTTATTTVAMTIAVMIAATATTAIAAGATTTDRGCGPQRNARLAFLR